MRFNSSGKMLCIKALKLLAESSPASGVASCVGAINILARGHRVLACGEPVQSGRSMKQEPTEAIKAFRRDAVGIAVLQGGEDVNEH